MLASVRPKQISSPTHPNELIPCVLLRERNVPFASERSVLIRFDEFVRQQDRVHLTVGDFDVPHAARVVLQSEDDLVMNQTGQRRIGNVESLRKSVLPDANVDPQVEDFDTDHQPLLGSIHRYGQKRLVVQICEDTMVDQLLFESMTDGQEGSVLQRRAKFVLHADRQ